MESIGEDPIEIKGTVESVEMKALGKLTINVPSRHEYSLAESCQKLLSVLVVFGIQSDQSHFTIHYTRVQDPGPHNVLPPPSQPSNIWYINRLGTSTVPLVCYTKGTVLVPSQFEQHNHDRITGTTDVASR